MAKKKTAKKEEPATADVELVKEEPATADVELVKEEPATADVELVKEEPATADVELVEEYDATRYTPWVPDNMPVGGKSNSTEQLNDHPTEHNHSAEAISDIVDRFADLRLYVPAANSCGVDGDLQVDGSINVAPTNALSFGQSTLGGQQVKVFDSESGAYGIGVEARRASIFAGGQEIAGFYNDLFTKLLGDLQVDGQTIAKTGTPAAPAYSFTNDTKTGIYYTGPGGYASKAIVSISADGSQAANFGDKGCSIPPVYANTSPNRANVFINSSGDLYRSTATVFDIEESDYNELVEKVAALTAQIETLMERVESLERATPITADA